ncbi:MAG: undecaprenyldiphospho-muramoylpentapeptide beta-N-acetylglucosaminyltransferase [Deltaproteobacteria bacterium]
MRVIIAGGGTAGHINPGIAVAKCIKSKYKDAEFLFVGTERGLEKELVPAEDFKIEFIKARGLTRKFSLDIFFTASDMIKGYAEAKKIIKEFKPDVVLGMGGYVCFPVMMAASRLRIPTLIHESNSLPGIANKILSRFVTTVAVSFKDSEKYFKKAKKLVFTGNPVREEIFTFSREEARVEEGLQKDAALVLVFGGSRGAQKINQAIIEMIKIKKGILPYNLILSTGKTQYEAVLEKLKESGYPIEELENIKIVPYIYDMPRYLSASDLIVGRAGAVTVSEITAAGVASILIPFPYATENHQEFNARSLEMNGASIVILDKDLTGEILNQQITSLVDNKEQLLRMAKSAKKMGVLDAAQKIVAVIEESINK